MLSHGSSSTFSAPILSQCSRYLILADSLYGAYEWKCTSSNPIGSLVNWQPVWSLWMQVYFITAKVTSHIVSKPICTWTFCWLIFTIKFPNIIDDNYFWCKITSNCSLRLDWQGYPWGSYFDVQTIHFSFLLFLV